jgi:hypothetical protein
MICHSIIDGNGQLDLNRKFERQGLGWGNDSYERVGCASHSEGVQTLLGGRPDLIASPIMATFLYIYIAVTKRS